MPGKNKIALFGMGGVGGFCAKAVLGSEADCLELRDALDVPQIDIKECCKTPVVLMEKEQYDVLGPVRLKNLEQKYGIQLVGIDVQMPFPKDELLEMKDKIKTFLEDKHVPPLVNICSSSKGRSHQQEARGMAKKKKAKRRRQKDARRNNRR